MPNVRQALSLDISAAAIAGIDIDLAVPSGQIVRINDVLVTVEVSGVDIGAFDSIFAAILTRDLSLTALDNAQVEAHTGIIGYTNLRDNVVSSNGTPVIPGEKRLNMDGDTPYGFIPRIQIGMTAVSANTAVVNALFDIDYDIIRLTASISSSVSVLV